MSPTPPPPEPPPIPDLMKPLLLTALFAIVPLTALPAAGEPEKSAAERILEITGFEATGFEAARASFRPVIEEFRAEGYDAEVLRKIEAAADAFFHKVMSDPALKREAVALYKANFTEDELEELLAFYQTPLGRKTLVQLPKILEESMSLGQKVADKHAPAFQEQLTDILAEADAKAHPAPEPDDRPDPIQPEANPEHE